MLHAKLTIGYQKLPQGFENATNECNAHPIYSVDLGGTKGAVIIRLISIMKELFPWMGCKCQYEHQNRINPQNLSEENNFDGFLSSKAGDHYATHPVQQNKNTGNQQRRPDYASIAIFEFAMPHFASSLCQGLIHEAVPSCFHSNTYCSRPSNNFLKGQRQCIVSQPQQLITACGPLRSSAALPAASRRICRCQASSGDSAETNSSGGKVL
jgi:hypothetical protein